MQVGVNCPVRITKGKRKSSKAGNVSNYVTHVCHFCKHGNSKPGTPKDQLKAKISQIAVRSNLDTLGQSSAAEIRQEDSKSLPVDLTKTTKKKKKKKKKQGSAKKEGLGSVGMSPNKGPLLESITSSKKRKRKGWSSWLPSGYLGTNCCLKLTP